MEKQGTELQEIKTGMVQIQQQLLASQQAQQQISAEMQKIVHPNDADADATDANANSDDTTAMPTATESIKYVRYVSGLRPVTQWSRV